MNYHRPVVSALCLAAAAAWRAFRSVVLTAGVLIAMTAWTLPASAQAPAPQKGRSHAKPSPSHAVPVQAQAPAAPPAPEAPHWPANDAPAKPSVTWDSQGLRIDATNASLREILTDVSTVTGAKVEGLGTDERVFGEYGPGAARDVLSQLLHGSAYNVLMIGDQGTGTPREIVLSARRSSGNNPTAAHPASENSDEDVTPEQPESEDQPPPVPQLQNNGQPPTPPQGPPGAPRTPQQVLQELQQRQQQMQEQQQQQLQQLQQQPH